MFSLFSNNCNKSTLLDLEAYCAIFHPDKSALHSSEMGSFVSKCEQNLLDTSDDFDMHAMSKIFNPFLVFIQMSTPASFSCFNKC